MTLLRNALLRASENSWLRERAPRYGFVRSTVSRFLPGEQLDDALRAARRLADEGISTLLTHLGENVAGHTEAESITEHYLQVIESIRTTGLPSEISVKLTQLGLDLDQEVCRANLLKLVKHSSSLDRSLQRTVWIDMEHSPYVDVTLTLYREVRKTYDNVGVCVQAYLYRTERDIEALMAMGASVRLVKGAYSEPPEIAFPKKQDVDENYFELAQRLLSSEGRARGVRTALATHDRKLIARIAGWAAEEGLAKEHLEFVMLYGIQSAEQLRLARQGYRCGVLVSYGSFWFPWFMRRLAERPANMFFLARNLFAR